MRFSRRAGGAAVAGALTVAAIVSWAATRSTTVPRPQSMNMSPGSTVSPGSAAPTVHVSAVPSRRPVFVNGRRQPDRVTVPENASGRYRTVGGTAASPRGRRGGTVRYRVEVEKGLPFDAEEFAADVHTILTDRRGWGKRFQRVSHGPVAFRVSLSSPGLARARCLPLDVGLSLSCWQHGRAVINADRWASGAPTYGRDLATYREYVINHEVGHALGHGHTTCPSHGAPAPVMVQQTKSLDGCRPNPWPNRTT